MSLAPWVQLDPAWVSDSGSIYAFRVADAGAAFKEWLEQHVPGNKLVLHTEITKDPKPSFFVPAATHFVKRSWAAAQKLLVDLLRMMNVRAPLGQVKEILGHTALLGTLAWENATLTHPSDRDQAVFTRFNDQLWSSTTWPLSLQQSTIAKRDNETWGGIGQAPIVDEPDGNSLMCPDFRAWMVERWPDHHEAVLDIISQVRVLGLLGLGGASEQAVNFMGPSGGGKSTVLNIITHSPDGAHTTARVTPHNVNEPFHRYEIMTARWSVIDDDDYDWGGIVDFKALLSPYPVMQRTLYERPEKLGNKSQVIMANNQPPHFGSGACEDATYRRFVLVPPPVPVPMDQRVRGWDQQLLAREGPAIRRLLWERGYPAVAAWVAGHAKLFTTAPYDIPTTRHLWLSESAPYYRDVILRKFVYTGDPNDVLKCQPLIAELEGRAFEKDPVVRGRIGNLGYLMRTLAREKQAKCSLPDAVVGVKRK